MQRTGMVVLCLMVALLTAGAWGIAGAGEDEAEMCIPMGSFEIAPPDSVDAKRPATILIAIDCEKNFGLDLPDAVNNAAGAKIG